VPNVKQRVSQEREIRGGKKKNVATPMGASQRSYTKTSASLDRMEVNP